MKILVTGSAGFIGHHLTLKLLRDGHEVVGLDSLNDYYDVNMKYDKLLEFGIEKESLSYNSIVDICYYIFHKTR
ncbi:MAG: NAD-dependent epimerase/dehydratase family protein [Sphingobacteriales bacterium]|nr:MAG: NAD-dependent epimerase/dehydratase family protein [Sphingobacteriales bacterium]